MQPLFKGIVNNRISTTNPRQILYSRIVYIALIIKNLNIQSYNAIFKFSVFFRQTSVQQVIYFCVLLCKEKNIYNYSPITTNKVAHSFDSRLISSYEDKIVKRNAGGIIGRPFREFYKRINITFVEFITALVVISRTKCREEKIFQFLKYFVVSLLFSDGKTCSLNSHYNPYYFNCDYCNVPYHYIGKLEHWDEDIANIAKVEDKLQISFLVIFNIISEGKSTATACSL